MTRMAGRNLRILGLLPRLAIILLLPVITPSIVYGVQLPDLSETAAVYAKALDASIVVFDFVGPDGSVTLLGRGLADDFSAELAKFKNRSYVVDRAYLTQAMEKRRLAPVAIEDADVAAWMAKVVGAHSFVRGKISRDGENLRLEVECLKVDHEELVPKNSVALPLNPGTAQLLKSETDPDAEVESSDLKGRILSAPICENCGSEPDPNPAVEAKFKGTVALLAVVGVDGRARDLQVIKGLSYGLTIQALEKVLTWKFVPSKDVEGRAVTVRTPVEVKFQLY